ncbi:MFS general substrate transporter [Podospora appendiculata]|uniref:MFS general substrate transporter n=1 Tax=Podospora appendiculata TaxID=314037 RepID=A0AAE0XLA7_9PEZI|nr:MFS general substrate transporter [Podospora appendiculata]
MASNAGDQPQSHRGGWQSLFRRPSTREQDSIGEKTGLPKWNMGILNDRETIEVPGSVLLLAQDHNEPLGLRNAPAKTSHSTIPAGILNLEPEGPPDDPRKKTRDGKIILEPQPEESMNDPLNWPAWRRDSALLSLGLFCMVGGGMTPILAAGFTNVAEDFNIDVASVSLTTGLYMMGMGLGSVVFSPTAILYGKRPVYLFGAVLFVITSIWCAVSPNFTSLVIARIFQGVSVSPVECLPSATIAEIFFLHERAFRIGIYTLLLLGGKNLVPLVSAAIMQSLSWRWVFYIAACIVAFCGLLLFLFVPETFWDRMPHKHHKSRNSGSRPSFFRRYSSKRNVTQGIPSASGNQSNDMAEGGDPATQPHARLRNSRVSFSPFPEPEGSKDIADGREATLARDINQQSTQKPDPHSGLADTDTESQSMSSSRLPASATAAERQAYTVALRDQPARSFIQQLKPFHGRLKSDKWHKVAIRPLILFSYPAVLWSAIVYSCSVGWLIVISESVAVIYRDSDKYNFNALQTGLVYISPFIGGVLGTAVAGKVSDIIVKAMARRNGGLYEPEFRLVMAIPVAITTVIGLMGFGWSAQVADRWIVPTVFFGIVSFGCSLGSTTSITFCVDSYRQYAGEALVTLNFSKNIFHGLVFSLFVTEWLKDDGAKTVYVWIGIIQLVLLVSTIPMYIYGKRARMWTVRKNFMEKF